MVFLFDGRAHQKAWNERAIGLAAENCILVIHKTRGDGLTIS